MTTTISNPPYNMKWKHPFFAESQARFDFGVAPESNANFSFIETALDQSSRCVFLLPNNATESNNEKEKVIRDNLVKSNYLKCVIALPGNMFDKTNIPTTLLIFDKKKETRTVQMIDLIAVATEEVRGQRGQIGKNKARVYTKKFNVLSDDVIDDVSEILKNDLDQTEISRRVPFEEIEANDFNITPKRYLKKEKTEEYHRDYKDIVGDLNRIISYKNGVKITINENAARALNVYDLALSFKNAHNLNENMNEMLGQIGLKINKEDVLTLSRYKELKFEVKDFERMPEIIQLFFGMWKQQIMMLNNEENRLLAELRDALLPDLLNGVIKLEE